MDSLPDCAHRPFLPWTARLFRVRETAEMAACTDDDATRVAQARTALQRGLERLRAVGFDCTLTQTADGVYERIALTYAQPGQERCVISDGWVIGERDNEALSLSWMTLELLRLVGAHEPSSPAAPT